MLNFRFLFLMQWPNLHLPSILQDIKREVKGKKERERERERERENKAEFH